jgi:hypothetical protein
VKAGIIVDQAMEQKHTGLGRYGDFYFIGYFQAATAFEMFLANKDLDVTLQLLLIRLGQQPVVWHIPFYNRQPLGRKLLSSQPISPSFFESEHIFLSLPVNSFIRIYTRLNNPNIDVKYMARTNVEAKKLLIVEFRLSIFKSQIKNLKLRDISVNKKGLTIPRQWSK